MAERKKKSSKSDPAKRPMPAMNRDARENQLIMLAEELAEKQILEGTASSQIITHYLKLGSTKEQLEKEKLRKENELLIAKVEALQSARRVEELYEEAIKAMSRYRGEYSENVKEEA